ncbi:MAG: hypothetical protein A2857_02600 [Candidatus Levybacteria bacterium RIFCSPHIGHO2_01_FULL_36_15]|nr:MAG: hypothetical protein A2857_02600 [Candidatus Levybacteria bacterium RIFCSPHIGHO2_01_FULL_36_15]OGH38877.1 MAG: hypothetical protein A2905_04315 [Candidatus Levybacteria bacterium RIFCSPLOWO2_01_FULL_36_10]
MNEKKENSSNGFVWGMLIGASLVLLLGTKKGRKILEKVSEKGLETIENIVKNQGLDCLMDEDEEVQEMETSSREAENNHSAGKRFFKGIKKKS